MLSKAAQETKTMEKTAIYAEKTHRKMMKKFTNAINPSLESFSINMEYLTEQSQAVTLFGSKLSELKDKDLSHSHAQLEDQLDTVCKNNKRMLKMLKDLNKQ